MADPTRPLALADLWLPGGALDGALLRGWNGPVFWFMHTDGDSADTLPSFERIDGIHVQELEPDEAGGRHLSFIPNKRFGRHVSFPPCLDFRRPEVRDRAVRVLGPDLLPIHAAELRGDITPGEAAGLVWCSAVRREAGMGVCLLPAPAAGAQLDPLDSMRLAAGYSLREPDGVLLLPLPDGVVGRLDTSR